MPKPVTTGPTVFDVCIVGAGVAGSALAWYLGRQGVNVAVVEQEIKDKTK